MDEDSKLGFAHLIEKEITSEDKILKPDFSQKQAESFLHFIYNQNLNKLLHMIKRQKNLFLLI